MLRHFLFATFSLLLWVLPAHAIDFSWQDAKGHVHSLEDYQGQAVMVHLWASWCGPCRMELPEMSAWVETHPDIALIPVSLDDTLADAREFIRSHSLSLPSLITDNAQAYRLGIRGLPTTVLIDAKGNILARHVGAQNWQGKQFNQEIAALFK